MSSGLAGRGVAAAYARGRQVIREQNADAARLEFLKRLDASENIEVSGWEAQFIASALRRDKPGAVIQFTPKQRTAIDRMRGRYTSIEGAAQQRTLSDVEIARAVSGTCQYLERVDGKLCECGNPAAYKGRTKPFLLYCKTHGQYVSRSFEIVALEAGPDGRRETLKPLRF